MLSSSRDNWERLVAAAVKKNEIWELCHQNSMTTVSSNSPRNSDFSGVILSDSGNRSERLLVSPPHLPPIAGASGVEAGKNPSEPITRKLFSALRWRRKPKDYNLGQVLVGIRGTEATTFKPQDSGSTRAAASPALGITVEKSVEFSYEELASATDNFSLAHRICEGGFGDVYYAELGGEKAAIKKMDMHATNEFLAELKVLTNVHHLNLVRLIGYCTEGSLFLVYEYIESGNLSQHLRGSGREPLPWSTRIQIALDSARGLEYIHEYTVPVYIHCDIKPGNILIDKNSHAKVASFGLAKLTDVENNFLPTKLLRGTYGYMPPEYFRYGDVTPKVDVYAFGVVIFELISAKEAIVKQNGNAADFVALFEDVLTQPDPTEDLKKLIDPRLGDNYPLDSVLKVAQLARACTHENPQLRPSMRSVVVALMTLSSFNG